MKIIYRNLALMVVSIALFGWAISSMYHAQLQFAEITKNPEAPWSIEVNFTPIVVVLVILGVIALVSLQHNKKKWRSWKKAVFLPPELEESDEREKQITSEACRAAYISLWYAAPIVTSLLLFYPFVIDVFPYYPIMVILLLPLIQVLVYSITWVRKY
ncbi:hypothetical protein ACERII_22905 [Evansella sp. AB-rgal1]|uniref:hypothetical protein n=1 Tax=Evansella sp. AB-rgal1 TaxID=3242696 RepID=UPI00359D84F3